MKALELENICQSHADHTILDIDSLAVERGETVAVVGPNGSGKTTLMTVAALLNKPDTGLIKINGKAVDWRSREQFRKDIGFMAQEPYFFRGTLQKNMEIASTGNGVDKYVARLGLTDLLHRSPRTFSSGERKRAAIARTLVREPSILILDEPFTFIDASSAVVLEETITNLPDDRTVLFSTHDLSYAYRIADRVVTLQGGKISPWTPENVFRMNAYKAGDGYELKTQTGLAVYFPGDLVDGSEYVVSVNPNEVLVSMQEIETSARNSYNGDVRKIEVSGTRTVLLTVDCASDFHLRANLTDRALKELGTGVGDKVWVHFKSTAIHLHE